MDLVLREVPHRGPDYIELVDLRQRILRVPFGHPLTIDELAAEESQIHLAGFVAGKLVACLLLKVDGEAMRMRQVAVDETYQGTGIGSLLVRQSEEIARREGAADMVLHARNTAIEFYSKLGYQIHGEMFVEIDIPHVVMRKRLD